MANKKYETAFRFYPLMNQAVSNMKTKNRGRTTQWDTMELISEYTQEKHGANLKPSTNEAEMGLEMQADNIKKAETVRTMVKKMYKHNSNYIKNQYFTVVQYDKNKEYFRVIGHWAHSNMRHLMNLAGNNLNSYMRQHKSMPSNIEYMLMSREGGPMWCSASQDLTNNDCRRMLGFAIKSHQNYMEGKKNSPMDPTSCGINDHSGFYKGIYIALVRDKSDKVVRLNFTSNQATSKTQFKNMVGEGKAYKAGVLIFNTRIHKSIYAQESAYDYEQENLDTYEIFAQYLQEHCGLYKVGKTNEDDLGMYTVRTR